MKHFETEGDALAYVMPELIATLEDDLGRMEGAESQHYEDEERAEMKARIADLRQIEPYVTLSPLEPIAKQPKESNCG